MATKTKERKDTGDASILVTVAEEVKRTGLARATVYAMAANGSVRCVKVGQSVYLYRGRLTSTWANWRERRGTT